MVLCNRSNIAAGSVVVKSIPSDEMRQSRTIYQENQYNLEILTISIIIATWNAAKTLNRCLDSIVPQLTEETELILVDGGSTDRTNEIIKSYGDKIAMHVTELDRGIYDAWNKGVRAAHGEWVMFVGADDRLLPASIRHYLTFIKQQTEPKDLISSKRMMVTLNNKEMYAVGSLWSWPSCLKGMPISHPGALHSKHLFEEVGLYDISYKIAADYELLLRKGAHLKTAFLDEVTILVSEGGVSDSYEAISEYFRVLRNLHEVPYGKALWLYLNMYLHFSVKKFIRFFGIHLHS